MLLLKQKQYICHLQPMTELPASAAKGSLDAACICHNDTYWRFVLNESFSINSFSHKQNKAKDMW